MFGKPENKGWTSGVAGGTRGYGPVYMTARVFGNPRILISSPEPDPNIHIPRDPAKCGSSKLTPPQFADSNGGKSKDAGDRQPVSSFSHLQPSYCPAAASLCSAPVSTAFTLHQQTRTYGSTCTLRFQFKQHPDRPQQCGERESKPTPTSRQRVSYPYDRRNVPRLAI